MKRICFLIVLIGFVSVLSYAQDNHPVASSAKISFDYCYKTFGDAIVVKTNAEPSVDHPYILNYMYGTEPLSQQLTSSGEQKVVFTKANGCDHEVNVNLIVETVPEGVLNSNAVFSVSATQQVYFSQGNLQYQGSTNTYRFADTQSELLNKEQSYATDTWLDKFPYGSSGAYKYRYSNIYAYPYTTNSDDQIFPNENIAGTENDWGIHNPISNGGEKGYWRSLTKTQFDYIVSQRTSAASKRGFVRVHNVYGLLLLPDEWEWPITKITMSTSIASGKTWSSVPTISDADWILMENNGAVFLPATTTANKGYGLYFFGSYISSSMANGVLIGYNQNSLSYQLLYDNTTQYTLFKVHTKCFVRLVRYK